VATRCVVVDSELEHEDVCDVGMTTTKRLHSNPMCSAFDTASPKMVSRPLDGPHNEK
jgi:hypothetical protein